MIGTAEVLMRKMEVLEGLPANYDSKWRPTASHECVTRTAQVGGVWLRLFRLQGDARSLNAGLKAVDQAAGRQRRSAIVDVDAAVPGSFPV